MSQFQMRLFASLMVFVVSMASINAAPLELDPQTTLIVRPNQPKRMENHAAGLLRDQLMRVYRVKDGFKVKSEAAARKADPKHVRLLLNTSTCVDDRKADLRSDGFVLKRVDNKIMMTGPSDASALFAAVAFLDHCAGVRFYMPTNTFTSLPDHSTVTVDGLDMVSEPFVTSCYFSGIDHDDRPAASWVTRVGGWRRKGGTHQHNMFTVFDPRKYAEQYPEIYPIFDGQRHIPPSNRDQGWQINFLAPRAIDVAMQSAKAHFERRPDHQYMAVSINDGGRFDQSEETRKVLEAFRDDNDRYWHAKATSAMYWDFMTRLGERFEKEFPGKKLVGLAYGGTRFPPKQPLPDCVMPWTNFHIAQLPIDGFLESTPSPHPRLHEWLAVSKNYANHDWYHGGGYQLPRIYTGYWQQFLTTLQQKVPETYQHVECYPHWGLAGPKLYLLAKLMWNPKVDTDALLTQYCNDMFGNASGPMKKYFTTLEQLWAQLNCVEGPERKLHRWPSQFKTTETSRAMVAACRTHLNKAASLAADDLDQHRVSFFSDTFTHCENLFRFAAADAVTVQQYETAVAYANELVKKHPMSVRYHKRPAEALKAVYWDVLKRARAWLPLGMMQAPAIDGRIDKSEWSAAEQGQTFVIAGGGKDRQRTEMKISRDNTHLFIAITCPRVDDREFVESEQTTWRCDNIEVFFDTQGTSHPEHQMWVQTTGRVVDWSGRNNKTPAGLKGAIVKSEGKYTVEIAVPFTYFGIKPSAQANFNLQVMRNEFTPTKGRNELTYQAICSRRIRFK